MSSRTPADDDFFEDYETTDTSPIIMAAAAANTNSSSTLPAAVAAISSGIISTAAGGGIPPPSTTAPHFTQGTPIVSGVSATMGGGMAAAVPMSAMAISPPHSPHHQQPNNIIRIHAGGVSSSGASAVEDVSREFYRRAVLRVTTIMLMIGIICLFSVPIIAIMLLPVGGGVVWWLRSTSRFAAGGDPTRCFNRNSCLNFYIIVLCVTIFVNVVDIIFLGISLMGIGGTTGQSAAAGSSGNSNLNNVDYRRSPGNAVTAPSPYYTYGDESNSSYHSAHRSHALFEFVINAGCGSVASYALFVSKKLQKLLD